MNEKKIAEAINAELAKMLSSGLIDDAQHEIITNTVTSIVEDFIKKNSKIEVIDEKRQKFNGMVFKNNKDGHYRRELSIHQAVWMYHNGEIPEGQVIHHIDTNPGNNDISNLQILSNSEHHKLHQKLLEKEYICDYCGKKIIKSYFKTDKGNHFCNSTCKALWRNQHINIITCKCQICGKEFTTRKRAKNTAVTCSPHCRNVLRWRREREKQGTAPPNNLDYLQLRKSRLVNGLINIESYPVATQNQGVGKHQGHHT